VARGRSKKGTRSGVTLGSGLPLSVSKTADTKANHGTSMILKGPALSKRRQPLSMITIDNRIHSSSSIKSVANNRFNTADQRFVYGDGHLLHTDQPL
jgi:hypothetical protein